MKEHLISTCGSVKDKIKKPIYGLGPDNFQWQNAFMFSRNPAILNKLSKMRANSVNREVNISNEFSEKNSSEMERGCQIWGSNINEWAVYPMSDLDIFILAFKIIYTGTYHILS